MYEVNFTSSNLNLIDFANFTTDFVDLDLNRSELEIRMNISKMRVGKIQFSVNHQPGRRGIVH